MRWRDEVKNCEFLIADNYPCDRRLRFNGNVFMVEIEKLQTTIFDPSIANLFFSENAADAEVYGLEGDITYLPASIDGPTLSPAHFHSSAQVTEVLVPTEV